MPFRCILDELEYNLGNNEYFSQEILLEINIPMAFLKEMRMRY